MFLIVMSEIVKFAFATNILLASIGRISATWSHTYRKLGAQRLVLLPIALRDCDRTIVVVDTKRIICNVVHATKPTTTV